jgi:hypothetical protein
MRIAHHTVSAPWAQWDRTESILEHALTRGDKPGDQEKRNALSRNRVRNTRPSAGSPLCGRCPLRWQESREDTPSVPPFVPRLPGSSPELFNGEAL